MRLRKDDPVYYKKKLKDLIRQAKENDIEINLEWKQYRGYFLKFESEFTREVAAVNLNDECELGLKGCNDFE